MKKKIGLAIATLAFVASCGGTSRADLVEQMTDAGVPEDLANCAMDKLEEAGFEPGDLTDDKITSEGEEAATQAMTDCVLEE